MSSYPYAKGFVLSTVALKIAPVIADLICSLSEISKDSIVVEESFGISFSDSLKSLSEAVIYRFRGRSRTKLQQADYCSHWSSRGLRRTFSFK